MNKTIIPLIVCGGAGLRLWPASRENHPKQFLPLLGSSSTFQETLKRVSDPAFFARPIIVTNAEYRFLVAEQLAEISMEADILLEPARRKSGPAIALGTTFALHRDGEDAIIVAVAADHFISNPAAFVQDCANAAAVAEAGWIVTFGVPATRPATEYGYIRAGQSISAGSFAVKQFIEKPDVEAAKRYVADVICGIQAILLFRARLLLDEYQRFEPDTSAAIIDALNIATQDLDFIAVDVAAFMRASGKSIDQAVLERTERAAVMRIEYVWSDVGSWGSVWNLSRRDAAGNAAQGSAIFVDARNCYVTAEKAGRRTTRA